MKPLVTVARFASVLPKLAKRRAACGAVLASLAGCGRLVGADFTDLKPVLEDARPPESGSGPEICNTCETPPSCGALPPQCGPNQDQDCCTSYIVPGGTFNRDNNPAFPATISRFALDAYEVTVGRFRSFLTLYPKLSWPVPGVGRHPKGGPETGWQEMWELYMPASADAMQSGLSSCDLPHAWTPEPAENENRPIACVTWYVAFAFCAWDRGRLPTEAEWSLAAVGGAEQRVYPWSVPPADETVGPKNGSFDCASRNECGSLASLLAVGTRPAGNGRWGHADLLGNLWEWTLDQQKRCSPCDCDACAACVDCTNPSPEDDHAYRIVHGGSFETLPRDLKLAQTRENYAASPGPFGFANDLGFRCARDPK